MWDKFTPTLSNVIHILMDSLFECMYIKKWDKYGMAIPKANPILHNQFGSKPQINNLKGVYI